MSEQDKDKDIIENFQSTKKQSVVSTIISIVWVIVTLTAIYYSFVIYKGFDFGGFILALLFAPIYLIYGIYKVGFPPQMKFNKYKKK